MFQGLQLLPPPANGTVTVNPDGTFVYTPNPGFSGEDKFTVTVSDGKGGTTTVDVPVTVTPSETQPGITPPIQPVVTDEDTPTIGKITVVDPDGGTPTFTLTTPPTHGTVTINPDGTFEYTPSPNYNGGDKFTVTVDDGNGGITLVEVPVMVNPVNDAPVAKDDVGTYDPASSTFVGSVLKNDADPDGDPLKVTSFVVGGKTYAPGQTVELLSTNGDKVGSLTVKEDGSYVFVPQPGYAGSVPKIDYTVTDGKLSDTATLTFPGNPPVNPAP